LGNVRSLIYKEASAVKPSLALHWLLFEDAMQMNFAPHVRVDKLIALDKKFRNKNL